MKSRTLLTLPSLSIGLAFALSVGASQFSMSSRATFGPSLNKDIPSTAPSSTPASSVAGPAASSSPPTQTTPQSTAQPPAQPPSQSGPQLTAAQPGTVIIQSDRPASAMERAGQMVRSVLRKIDPKTTVVAPQDSVDLNRSRSGAGPSVNTTASISVPPNSALTAASDTNASGTLPTASSERPPQSTPINTSMNKQERKVANADPSVVPRQLQRGLMNEQKMNVGMNQ